MGEKKLIQEAKLGLRAAGAHVAVAYRMRSQQIGEGGQRHNGSGVANLLEVARGTSSTSTTSRRGRAATTALGGGGAGAAAGAGRVGRASRKLRDVELAALVIDRDGAVALASGIAGVEFVALTEGLLADELWKEPVLVIGRMRRSALGDQHRAEKKTSKLALIVGCGEVPLTVGMVLS